MNGKGVRPIPDATAHVVHERSACAPDTIEENINQVAVHTDEGTNQLVDASKYQVRQRLCVFVAGTATLANAVTVGL